MRILLAGRHGRHRPPGRSRPRAAGHEVVGLARDMALSNRLRTSGTASLIAAADGTRVIVQGVAYAYDPAGSPVKDEDAPLWLHPPTRRGGGGALGRTGSPFAASTAGGIAGCS